MATDLTADWIDVTLPLRDGMATWPGDPNVVVETKATVEKDGFRLSRLDLGCHAGTHIDAPAHFLAGGGGVDAIAPWRLVGPCRVVDLCSARGPLRRQDLEAVDPRRGERLLLKTANGTALREGRFPEDYVGLDVSACRFLAEREIALVGIDFMSIEPFEAPEHPGHKALLERDVAIVESVDLADVAPGAYDLIAMPLRIVGADGSPARVLLRPTCPRGSGHQDAAPLGQPEAAP